MLTLKGETLKNPDVHECMNRKLYIHIGNIELHDLMENVLSLSTTTKEWKRMVVRGTGKRSIK